MLFQLCCFTRVEPLRTLTAGGSHGCVKKLAKIPPTPHVVNAPYPVPQALSIIHVVYYVAFVSNAFCPYHREV